MPKKAGKGAAQPLRATSRQLFVTPPISNCPGPQLGYSPKLINRFYEPLELLRTLGQTRGERTPAESFYGSEQCIKRQFLRNLCYISDYQKGGKTTTAMALSERPETHTFWVGSNINASIKIVPFVMEVLRELETLSESEVTEKQEERFENRCLEFSYLRLKAEFGLLRSASKKCIEFLERYALGNDLYLVQWLENIASSEDMIELSRRAYETRKTAQMRELDKRAGIPTERHRGSIRESYAKVRDYMGRLAHHIRAPKQLVKDAQILQRILDGYDVKVVPFLQFVNRPLVKASRSLNDILGRMLPSNDINGSYYENALGSLDAKFNILKTIQEQYEDKNFTLEVHAEIQVLDHFFNNPSLKFSSNDRYIACSKPVCYCCHLYFQKHPTMPVEPGTHRKIWLKWGPPAPAYAREVSYLEKQRDTLNKMIEVIRGHVLQDLKDQDRNQLSHPDSHTGITQSLDAERIQRDDDSSIDEPEMEEADKLNYAI